MTRRTFLPLIMLAAVAAITAVSFCGSVFYPADLFSHFRLHIAVAAVVLAIVLVLLRHWRPALLAVALVAVNVFSITPARTVPVTPQQAGDLELTIATFYIWGHNDDLDGAAMMLEAARADIVLLQEVGHRADKLLAALKPDFPWRIDCGEVDYCDIAIYSRQPWTRARLVLPSTNQPAMLWARFEREGRVYTVANTHLNRPPWPIHLRQIDGISRNLADIRGPLILGGDFNATPWSYAITRLIEASGLSPLAGFRPTWPASLGVPQLPIDHVLVSGGIRNLSVVRGPYSGSDHLAVIARVAITDEAESMRR